MPDTQQQWFERRILEVNDSASIKRGFLITDIEAVAIYLASAWPSSPQGLVVKQMVEALEAWRIGKGTTYSLMVALDAARKAGLT